jgi:uncharacterized RDD family membrane protein YckC
MSNPDKFEPAAMPPAAPRGRPLGRESESQPPSRRARVRYANPAATPLAAEPESETAGEDRVHGGRGAETGIERIFGERQTLEQSLETQSKFWREEVANRVEGYRVRRSRKRLAGQFSMRLDFEAPPLRPALPEDTLVPATPRELPLLPAAAPTASPSAGCASSLPELTDSALPAALPAPQPKQPIRPPALPQPQVEVEAARQLLVELPGEMLPPAEAAAPAKMWRPVSLGGHVTSYETKVIEFPRFVAFPEFDPDPRALAEPVFDKPRILDVPETVGAFSTPPLADVALSPAGEEDETDATPEPEVPLGVAPLSQRTTAALIDALLVAVATGIFGTLVAFSSLGLTVGKPLLALALATPVFFWAVYCYLFLVHAAATPGMTLAGIRLRTFHNESVPRTLRRWRALVMVLSLVSLGFGFLWALLDPQHLCWHDKMTGTCLTAG